MKPSIDRPSSADVWSKVVLIIKGITEHPKVADKLKVKKP